MSPAIAARKRSPAAAGGEGPGKGGEGLGRQDWMWVGIAVACTWLLLTGLHRLFAGESAVSRPPAAVPAQTLLAPPEDSMPGTPAPELPVATPARRVILRDEAVRATVESLRQHAKECPDAPDALSEEQIKDIERRRALIL